MTLHYRAPTSANPAPPELAGDLRKLRDLLRENRDALSAPTLASESDMTRDDLRRMLHLTQFLMSTVEQLREERDALQRKLADQDRVNDLHAKFAELTAFAAAIRPDHEPLRGASSTQEQPDDFAVEEEDENWSDAAPAAAPAAVREAQPTRSRVGPRSGRAPSDRILHPSLRRA